MKKKFVLLIVAVLIGFGLSACSNNSDHNNHQGMDMDHSNMNVMHHGSGVLPAGMKAATNPAFKVGSTVVLKDDHMPGMKGANATVVGAYVTSVYTVSYVPTTGGEKVTNHKWVVHEEIKNAGSTPFSIGDEVTLEADHMTGMKGAKATIDTVQNTTIYVVDFTPTTGGEVVKNHMWMTESEITAK